MGDVYANGEFKSHAHGTDPITHDWEIGAHWGDENIDEGPTVLTDAQATDLHDDAVTGQAAFNTRCTSILSWFGFTTLDATKRATMRAAMRKSCAKSKPV
jgi:hypothetical protein